MPELFPAAECGLPDVSIRLGLIDGDYGNFGVEQDGEALLLTVPGIARYRVREGAEIIIDPVAGAPERNVRLYLLGSAFGALLHQRRMLPLHANAIEINGRAVGFMGESGAGKSTLAAWFHDRGYRILADDVCVVGFDDAEAPYAAAGLPRLRLWTSALEATGRDTGGLEQSYVEATGSFDKFDLPIPRRGAAQAKIPLAALYLLGRGPSFSIRQLCGTEGFEALFANTYRGAFVALVKNHKAHWDSVVRLVGAVSVYSVSREWGFSLMDRQCRRLLGHARAVTGSPDLTAAPRQ